jgi:hypothetical protein
VFNLGDCHGADHLTSQAFVTHLFRVASKVYLFLNFCAGSSLHSHSDLPRGCLEFNVCLNLLFVAVFLCYACLVTSNLRLVGPYSCFHLEVGRDYCN